MGKESCDFFVTREIAPYVLQNLTEAGRVRLSVSAIALSEVQVPEQEVRTVQDTVASLRLDSIVASGFRVNRALAAQFVTTGKVSVNGLISEKPDRAVAEGAVISVRGRGKMKVASIRGETKKGRIRITLQIYC